MGDKDFIAKIVAELDQNSLNATIAKINQELSKVKIDFGRDVFKSLETQSIVAARTMEETFRKSIASIRADLAALSKELGAAPAGVTPASIARRPSSGPTSRVNQDVAAIQRNIYAQLGAGGVPAPQRLQIVYPPTGPRTPYAMQYEIAELRSLIPSTNPAYKGYQPRPLDTEVARQYIASIASGLNPPELVYRSPLSNAGAPIVDALNNVISGNNRVTAMQLASTEKLAAYAAFLKENAAQFGISPEELARYQQPVLIQRPAQQLSEAQYRALAETANGTSSLARSVSQDALADAQRISNGALINMSASISRSLDENIQSSKQLIDEVLGGLEKTERASYQTGSGGLTQAAIDRVKAALFARVFPGEAGKFLTKQFAEEPDVNSPIKRIENALMKALPGIARVQALSEVGSLAPGLNIGSDLVDAVANYVNFKKSGSGSLQEFMGPTMFETEGRFSQSQQQFLQLLDENKNRQGVLSAKLDDYVQAALSTTRMAPESKSDLLQKALNIIYDDQALARKFEPLIAAPAVVPQVAQIAQAVIEQVQAPIKSQVPDATAQLQELYKSLSLSELKSMAAGSKLDYPGLADAITAAEAEVERMAQYSKQIGIADAATAQAEQRAAQASAQKAQAAQGAATATEQAAQAARSTVLPSGATIYLPPSGGYGGIPIGMPPAGGYPPNPQALMLYPGLGGLSVPPGMVPPGGGSGSGGTGGFAYGGGFVIPPGSGNPNVGRYPGIDFSSVGDIFKRLFGNAFSGVKNAFSPENLIKGKNPIWGAMGAGVDLAQQFSQLMKGGVDAQSVITKLGLVAKAETIDMAAGFASVGVAVGGVAAGAVLLGKAYLEAYQSSQNYLKGVSLVQRQLGATAQQASEIRNLLALTPHGADNPFAAISLTQLQANLQAMDDYDKGLTKTNKQLEQFIQGMNRLGLSATDSQGKVKSITDIIIDASEKLQSLSGGEYTRALQQLTGLFGSVDIAPIIGIDPNLLRQYRASAVQVTQEQLNLSLQRQIATQAAVNAEQQFNLQLTESLTPLDIQVQLLKQRALLLLASQVNPTDSQRLEQINAQLKHNNDLVAASRSGAMNLVGGAGGYGETTLIDQINQLQREKETILYQPEALRGLNTDRLNQLARQYQAEASKVFINGATDTMSQAAATIYSNIQKELSRRMGTITRTNLFEEMAVTEKEAFGKSLGKFVNDQTKEIVAAQKALAKSQADYVSEVSGIVQQIIATGVQYKAAFEKYRDVSDIITRGGPQAVKVSAQIREATQAQLRGALGLGGKEVAFPNIEKYGFDRKTYKALQDFRLNLEAINRETLDVGIGAFEQLAGKISENEPALTSLKSAGVDALDALAKSAGMFADSGFVAALGEAALNAKLLAGGFGDINDPAKVGNAFATYLDQLANFKQRIVELLPALEGQQKLTIPIALDLKLITPEQAGYLKDPKQLQAQIKKLLGLQGRGDKEDRLEFSTRLKLLIDTQSLGAALTGDDPKKRTQAILDQLYKESGLDQATLKEAFQIAFDLKAPEAADIQAQIQSIADQVQQTKIGVEVELRAKGINFDQLMQSYAGGSQFADAIKNNPIFQQIAGGLGIKPDVLTPSVQLAMVSVDADKIETDLIEQKALDATQQELDNLASDQFTGQVGLITLLPSYIDATAIQDAIKKAIDNALKAINAPAGPAPITTLPSNVLPPVQGPSQTDVHTYPLGGGRALGGYANGLTLVGESGREMLVGNGGYILSNTITDRLLEYAQSGRLHNVPVARTRSDRVGYNAISNINTSTVNYTLNVDARGAQGGRSIKSTLERLDVRALFQSSQPGASLRRARQLRGER